MDHDFVRREEPRLLAELTEFLAIPSISTGTAHVADCRRAAQWLVDQLFRLGCPTVQLIEGDGHPVVWGESPKVEGAPTLLIYGHYDVQPPDPLDEWHTPPFVPSIRDGRLYARGAIDDKGQVFCLLKAYEAVRDADGNPPLNVHFLFEGEDECGGRVVFDLLKAEPERTKVDAVLVCDTFPRCQGSWWPDMALAEGFELWRPLGQQGDGGLLSFAALTAIHYMHRLFAYAVFVLLLALVWRLHRAGALAAQRRALLALALLQLVTGLSNVVLGWPLLAAVLHTGGAAALMTALVWALCASQATARQPAGAIRPAGVHP